MSSPDRRSALPLPPIASPVAIPIDPCCFTLRRPECSPAAPHTSPGKTQPGSEAQVQLSAFLQQAFSDIVGHLEDVSVQFDSVLAAAHPCLPTPTPTACMPSSWRKQFGVALQPAYHNATEICPMTLPTSPRPSSTDAKDQQGNPALDSAAQAEAATAIGQQFGWPSEQRRLRSESAAESTAESTASSHKVKKVGAYDVKLGLDELMRGSMFSRSYSDFVNKAREGELRMVGIAHSNQLGESIESEMSGQSSCLWLRALSQHWLFDFTVFVVILANSVIIGLSVEAAARGMDIATFDSIEHLFSVFFAVELLIRVAAQGAKTYVCQKLGWNHFDAVIVLESLLSFCLSFAWSENSDTDFSNLRVMRSLKTAKLLRVLRIIRVIRFVLMLRLLVESIVAAMRLLMWTLVLLGVMVYVFATFFTGSVGLLEQDEVARPLRVYYGSIGDSCATLIQAICGGLSWRTATMPLRQASVAYEIAFLIYIAVSYLAIMNVMTGIMTAVALQASESDPEILALGSARDKKRQVRIARELFQFLDIDNSGKLTLEELEQSWADHRLDGYLEALNIKSHDALVLFNLLDSNGDGLVDFEELCETVNKASQGNFSVELMRLQLGQRWIMKNMMRDTPPKT